MLNDATAAGRHNRMMNPKDVYPTIDDAFGLFFDRGVPATSWHVCQEGRALKVRTILFYGSLNNHPSLRLAEKRD
jgi:hypothetical protein